MKEEINKSQKRLLVCFWVVMLFLIVLEARLVYIQILKREDFEEMASQQYKHQVKLFPRRGLIRDRHMKPLALNVPTVSVAAYPNLIPDKRSHAAALSGLLGSSENEILKILHKGEGFRFIKRQVDYQIGKKIAELKLNGIDLFQEQNREYPQGRLASQLIGFIGVEGKGLSGLELSCESILGGKPGRAILQRTASGNIDPFERPEYPIEPAKDGSDLVLTIDYFYQDIAEKELHRAIVENNANSGNIIIMNPKTGQILAMANEPNFNPNDATNFHPSTWRNRVITDQFEPGSTFKTVILSGILNEHIKSVDDVVYCEHGRYHLMNETLHDTAPYGDLTLRDVFVKSSNIGMAKTALQAEKNVLYKYARDFGFGMKTGVELHGEIEGTLKTIDKWSGFTPAAISYGHEIAVTALQMCNMFAVIANDGLLTRPTIIRQVRKDDQILWESKKPKVIRRVLHEETVEIMKELLCQAVEKGTGKKAAITGIGICGKTGTARMVKESGAGYHADKHVASFGGFFPKADPKVCMFIAINHPRKSYYGGDVAAPVFRRIANRIIDYEGMNYFDFNKLTVKKRVPNFIGLEREIAVHIAKAENLPITIHGNGSIVIAQSPKYNQYYDQQYPVTLSTVRENDGIMPNVRGLPVRSAISVLKAHDIHAVVEGSGKVFAQDPKPGSEISRSDPVLIKCRSGINMHELAMF
jgi:cell division protein FtsI (penicillin-binding protein 3)